MADKPTLKLKTAAERAAEIRAESDRIEAEAVKKAAETAARVATDGVAPIPTVTVPLQDVEEKVQETVAVVRAPKHVRDEGMTLEQLEVQLKAIRDEVANKPAPKPQALTPAMIARTEAEMARGREVVARHAAAHAAAREAGLRAEAAERNVQRPNPTMNEVFPTNDPSRIQTAGV